ncbi:MAG: hypothetical protein V1928_05605 [Parcubacteria group bacterium]
MKNIIVISLIAMFCFGLGLAGMMSPAQAIGQDVMTQIKGGADKVGQVGFGESQGGADALPTRIGRIINMVLGILGIIVVVIVVWAGFLWMTAGGDKEQITKAKDWMINAIIGLAILLSAYAITDFVISKLVEASGYS